MYDQYIIIIEDADRKDIRRIQKMNDCDECMR